MQPRNNAEISHALAQPLRGEKRMLKISRAPDFSRRKERELDSSGQYSNNAVWIPVQRHSLIDYVGIAAEPCMPERVTDHDHRLARGLSFIRLEETAKLRLDSQHIEKIC